MANHNEKMIMVIERVLLFSEEYFQGFSPADGMNYENVILDHYHYERREVAEKEPDLKQPIAYCLIINRNMRKVFAYQRSSKPGEYNEKRLRGKWSWGIGGHIDKVDLQEDNPIRASLQREIEEEIFISDMSTPQILGYINDDDTPVGQVHFGLLYLINTTDENVKPKDSEILTGELLSLEELEKIYSEPEISVETWSLIALSPLRKIFSEMNHSDETSG